VNGRRWGLRAGIVVALLAAVGTTAGFARARYLPAAPVLPGLSIAGETVPAGADAARVRAMVDADGAALAARKVRFVLPGDATPVLESTLGELGLRVDAGETAGIALRAGKTGDLVSRARAAEAARRGELDVPLVASVDRAVALPILERVKEREDREPVSARLDLDKHETIPEKDGRYIDADGAAAKLEALLRDPPARARAVATIELPVATFKPRISSAFLAKLDIHTVLAEYETYFGRAGEQSRRGKNIDNASQKLDGLVISPGEMVSFNQVVGERSEANGFYKSWEIFKGEMVEGIGGGTCQVASTLHAATFFAGLDVLERLPHSRPSAYIPMGLDATVVYPAVDLKIRNPHPFPVVVHAKTEGNKLRVEILGKERPVQVSFARQILETIPYKRKINEEPNLAAHKVVVKQHGIKGYRVKRSRILKYADGRTKKETSTDTYPATTEIYDVPVGFDVALLPALPGGDAEDAERGGDPAAPAAPATPRADASVATTSSSSSASSSASPSSPSPSPSPSSPSPAGATACADCTGSGEAIQFVDAPGAHAPTAAQKDASKSMWIKR
jgi:vancomycin resistance protein YoaR